MKMKKKRACFSSFIAGMSHFSFQSIRILHHYAQALLTGFWLGVMGEETLDRADELYYRRSSSYSSEEYNASGLYGWEKTMVKKYFSRVKTILLIAAGGGREVLALSKMGFEIDSYECNPELIESGNVFLKNHSSSCRIKFLSRNSVPPAGRAYDGIIIGWGAYSNIRGSMIRKFFLSQLKPLLKKNAPLMISFLTRARETGQDRVITIISNIFKLFKKRKTEPGDRLVSNFVHLFTRSEIFAELSECGFDILEYYNREYGCIITKKQE